MFGVHGEAHQDRRRVDDQDGPAGGGTQVHQRLPAAQFQREPKRYQDRERSKEAQNDVTRPAPDAALGNGQQQRRHGTGQQECPRVIETAFGAQGGLGHEEVDGSEDCQGEQGDDPKSRLPAKLLVDEPGHGQSQGAADPEAGAHEGNRSGDAPLGQRIPQDADPHRDHCPRGTLQGTANHGCGE